MTRTERLIVVGVPVLAVFGGAGWLRLTPASALDAAAIRIVDFHRELTAAGFDSGARPDRSERSPTRAQAAKIATWLGNKR